MERIWLVVDARRSPDPDTLPAELAAALGESVWLEDLAAADPDRRSLLLHEADAMVVDQGSEVLDLYPQTPAWIATCEAHEFSSRGFDGSLDQDVVRDLDGDFTEVQNVLGEPDASLAAVGAAAKQHAGAKRWYEYLEETVLVFSLLPVAVIAFAYLLEWNAKAATIVEQATILIAFGLAIVLWRSSSKDRWTDARAVREIWRSLSYSIDVIDPVHPPQARFFPRHRGLIRTLIYRERICRSGGDEESESAQELASRRERYVNERVTDQIEYFSKNRDRAKVLHQRFRIAFLLATSFSAVCAVITLVNQVGLFSPDQSAWLERVFQNFGGLLFPSVAAACLGIVGLLGTSRRAGFYGIMVDRLSSVSLNIAACDTDHGRPLRDLILETESILLEEVAGWVRRNEF